MHEDEPAGLKHKIGEVKQRLQQIHAESFADINRTKVFEYEFSLYLRACADAREERMECLKLQHGAVRVGLTVSLAAAALVFLWQDETIRRRLPHIEQTIIGHLHSDLFLQFSKVLSGMPVIGFLGSSVRKLSAALNQAHLWQPFRVRLCPSLAGIELLKDGGYYTAELDPEALRPVQFHFHPLPRKSRRQNEGRFISPGQ